MPEEERKRTCCSSPELHQVSLLHLFGLLASLVFRALQIDKTEQLRRKNAISRMTEEKL